MQVNGVAGAFLAGDLVVAIPAQDHDEAGAIARALDHCGGRRLLYFAGSTVEVLSY